MPILCKRAELQPRLPFAVTNLRAVRRGVERAASLPTDGMLADALRWLAAGFINQRGKQGAALLRVLLVSQNHRGLMLSRRLKAVRCW